DRLHHTFGISEHVVVPVSKYAVAIFHEPFVPAPVMRNPRIHPVLTTIDLDNDPGGITEKIGDIGSDRTLPPEMKALALHVFQIEPEPPLRLRLVSSQMPRPFICHGSHSGMERNKSHLHLPLAGRSRNRRVSGGFSCGGLGIPSTRQSHRVC